MGIRNRLVHLLIGPLAECSLPLMGIRNQARPHTSVRAPRAHYPSWGSGTPAAHRGPGRGRQLITPHGDQERVVYSDDQSQTNHSLPLMGIRNHPAPALKADIPAFSLPLMGIRNAPGFGPDRGATSAHYPSWGSGTSRPSRCAYRRCSPHYPSWGSGTIVLRTSRLQMDPRERQVTSEIPDIALGPLVANGFLVRRMFEPSKNRPVLAVPLVLGLAHRTAERILA